MLKKALMVAALGIATTSAFAVDVERVEKSIPMKDGSTVYIFKDGKMGMECRRRSNIEQVYRLNFDQGR